MSKRFRSINPFSRVNNDTGFGTSDNYGGRFVNKDGTFNIRREGLYFLQRLSMFQSMLNLPTWKFVLVLLTFFVSINLLFTMIYLAIGHEQLAGMMYTNKFGIFKEIYFFSTQTFTTVGYGRVNPIGDAANLVASMKRCLALFLLRL